MKFLANRGTDTECCPLSVLQSTGAICTCEPRILRSNADMMYPPTLRVMPRQGSGCLFFRRLQTRCMARLTCSMSGGVEHRPSWAFQTVQVLTLLWHFLLPVMDDITDLVLLWQTFDSTSPTLWWICAVVFAVAEYERIYVTFFVMVFLVRILLYRMHFYLDSCYTWDEESDVLTTLAFGQSVELDEAWMLFLDSVLWVLFGSRARSGDLMRQRGLAGEAPVETLNRGVGNNAIDVLIYYHPFRYLGAFVMSFPRERGMVTQTRQKSHRRTTAMVRAVGETLVVDLLFLALSVVSGGLDDNVTGLTFISGVFSILELVTELQYYITAAEIALPYSTEAKKNDDVEPGGAVASAAVGTST